MFAALAGSGILNFLRSTGNAERDLFIVFFTISFKSLALRILFSPISVLSTSLVKSAEFKLIPLLKWDFKESITGFGIFYIELTSAIDSPPTFGIEFILGLKERRDFELNGESFEFK